MRLRVPAVLSAAAAAAFLAAPPAHGQTGSLEMYSGPGINYQVLDVGDGCHTFDRRMVGFADSDPVADYMFYSGPDCTGAPLGSGRDDSQWIPPLDGVRSVHLQFDG
ncbi:hypothetical protein FHX37_4379 [Haloactinospora alba]|uniref:Beta/gamma crystallin n=1 Tax=Haloactinospora alba TaxID=405555 RepID=A0A543N753_9ACTN|nr:hypothetical protein [Haloactinospora alba]TQN27655.1 hypothetical protein FHX37_4379 [Haloactinospora alba]